MITRIYSSKLKSKNSVFQLKPQVSTHLDIVFYITICSVSQKHKQIRTQFKKKAKNHVKMKDFSFSIKFSFLSKTVHFKSITKPCIVSHHREIFILHNFTAAKADLVHLILRLFVVKFLVRVILWLILRDKNLNLPCNIQDTWWISINIYLIISFYTMLALFIFFDYKITLRAVLTH